MTASSSAEVKWAEEKIWQKISKRYRHRSMRMFSLSDAVIASRGFTRGSPWIEYDPKVLLTNSVDKYSTAR
jgi:hypothetical protein